MAGNKPEREDEPDQPDPPEGSEDSASDPEFAAFLRKVAKAPSLDPSAITSGVSRAQEIELVGQRLSHFRIVERLGAGGMGIVYKGVDERLGRPVALKVLPPRHVSDEGRQRRLLREARSAAAVNHPNIAAIYEVGEEGGVTFLAMEYLEGQTLRALIRAEQRRPLAVVLHDAEQIARGLARAHQAGIVHRDLKPDNVMLCPDRLIKILDFGLAKLRQAQDEGAPVAAPAPEKDGGFDTREGQVLGTPTYMSPEQAAGKVVDARSDIYSFGVLLLEMLTGKTAPAGPERDALVKTIDALAAGPHERPLASGARGIVERCLQPEPERRYADGASLLAALRQVRGVEEGFEGVLARSGPHAVPARRILWPPLVAVVLGVVGLVLAVLPAVLDRRSQRNAKGPSGPITRRLTANPPENQIADAAISPDGKVLAYVDRTGLFLRRLEPVKTDPVKLPERVTPQAVTWFPSGRELLVTGLVPGEEGVSVWVVSPGQPARRFAQGAIYSPRFSPDGKRIAWIAPQGISVGPSRPGRVTVVVPLEGPEQLDQTFDQLTWSPDGRFLAYLRFGVGASGSEASLEVVDVNGGKPSVLVRNPRLPQENGHGALVWAPDGRLLYGLAEWAPSEAGSTLWSLTFDPSTGQPAEPPRQIHAWTGSFPALLSISATGSLAYVLYETQVDVYVAELLEGGNKMNPPRRTTLTDHNERPSGWVRDGHAVLYMSDQDGSYDLFLQDVSTGATQALVAEPGAQTWPMPAPGGSDLLYWQLPQLEDDQPRQADLMRVPIAGGTPVKVLTTKRPSREVAGMPPPGNAHFRCAAQGERCVLGELEGGELAFSTFDPSSGRGKELLRILNPIVGHGWDLSPDGKRLAFPWRDGRIRTVDLETLKSVDRVIAPDCELQYVAWSFDGGGVFSTGFCPGERPYRIFFAEARKQVRVLWESSYAWAAHPVASPDGKYLAVAIRPFDNDAWMLSGL